MIRHDRKSTLFERFHFKRYVYYDEISASQLLLVGKTAALLLL